MEQNLTISVQKYPKENFERLFNWIPKILNHYKDELNNESNRGLRLRYLFNLNFIGIQKYIEFYNNYVLSNTYEPFYILEFVNEIELKEWIISGLNKQEQDEIFNGESSEEDIVDSP
jgi:hypothetical protein